jgi:hypothetical protein
VEGAWRRRGRASAPLRGSLAVDRCPRRRATSMFVNGNRLTRSTLDGGAADAETSGYGWAMRFERGLLHHDGSGLFEISDESLGDDPRHKLASIGHMPAAIEAQGESERLGQLISAGGLQLGFLAGRGPSRDDN